MKNMLRILLNLHSLRMFALTVTLAQLEDIHHKLSIVVNEARKVELKEKMAFGQQKGSIS